MKYEMMSLHVCRVQYIEDHSYSCVVSVTSSKTNGQRWSQQHYATGVNGKWLIILRSFIFTECIVQTLIQRLTLHSNCMFYNSVFSEINCAQIYPRYCTKVCNKYELTFFINVSFCVCVLNRKKIKQIWINIRRVRWQCFWCDCRRFALTALIVLGVL